jgi:hypothetical protein
MREGHRWARAAFVPLTASWANLHGSWVLAPLLLAFVGTGEALTSLRTQSLLTEPLKTLVYAVLSYLAAGLSVPGASIYLYPFHHAALASTAQISEWQPLSLSDSGALAFAELLVLVTYAAGRSRLGTPALLLPASAFVAAAFLHLRLVTYGSAMLAATGVALLSGISSPGLPSPLVEALQRIDGGLRRWNNAASGAVIPFVLLSVFAVADARHPMSPFAALPPSDFPVAALTALKDLPPGRVLNRARWGGAISYFTGNGHKVFIDGRNDPFPWQIHEDYTKLVLLEPGWREALNRYHPDYIVWGPVNHGAAFLDALHGMSGYREVVGDSTGSLWQRTDQAGLPATPLSSTTSR